MLTDEVPRALRAAPARERAREGQRRRAHQLRRAPVQRRRSRGSRAIRAWSSRWSRSSARTLYMHQFKINGKMAFDGDVWQWHQDYGTWKNDDLMPERARDERRDLPRRGERVQRPADVHSRQPQARRASTRSTTPRRRAIRCGRSTTTRSRKLVERGGIVAPKGPAGSMILFHSLPGARVDVEPVAVEPRRAST